MFHDEKHTEPSLDVLVSELYDAPLEAVRCLRVVHEQRENVYEKLDTRSRTWAASGTGEIPARPRMESQ